MHPANAVSASCRLTGAGPASGVAAPEELPLLLPEELPLLVLLVLLVPPELPELEPPELELEPLELPLPLLVVAGPPP
jgi:hypothetical protein